MRVKLTQAFVDKTKTAADDADRTIYWDEAMSGFGLMVMASGSQSFVFQYRANGRSRRLTLDGAFLRHEAANGKPRSSANPSSLSDSRDKRSDSETNGIDESIFSNETSPLMALSILSFHF